MGPIVVGTTVVVTVMVSITASGLFIVNSYIDTASIILTTPTSYMYKGVV
jgi:hypothetical protein